MSGHTPGHNLPPRVIYAAALLAERYSNPEAAAYSRFQGMGRYRAIGYIAAPSSMRRKRFWFEVGRALTDAYRGRGCRSDYAVAVRRSIESAIAKAKGGAA